MFSQSLDGRILITGAAGLIGSAVLWFLNRQGHDNILVADRLDQTDKWRNLAALSFWDYLEGPELRRRIAEKPESLSDIRCVFHLGACSSTTERDSAFLLDNNYAFTRELAAWAVQRNIRMVYASSAATYGDGSLGFDDEAVLTRLRPLNAYGYSKHLFDLYARREGWLDQLVGLKYFNVFGPNEQHKGEMRSMVVKAFEQIQSVGRVRLFKSHHPDYQDGEQQRDFLYVKQAAEWTVRMATSGACGLYNLGSGTPHSWNQLARAVFGALQRPEQIDYIDMPEELRGRYQYYTCARMDRAARLQLPVRNWQLNEAVEDYVRSYLLRDARLGDEPE